MNQLAPQDVQLSPETLEGVLLKGDLSKLNPQESLAYYKAVCSSIGLNPLTKPFEYMSLSGKRILYATRNCTDQLRNIHGISVEDMSESQRGDIYVVTCKVTNKAGRTDMSRGAVAIGQLKGDALANALMRAETKAKRRATLSICGLSFLDETELETVPEAKPLTHDPETGVIIEKPKRQIPTPPATPEPSPLSDHERAERFVNAYIEKLPGAKNNDELVAFAQKHKDLLDKITRSHPNLATRLRTAELQRRLQISDAMPEDPQVALRWVERRLERFDDPQQFIKWFDEQVAPHQDIFDPADWATIIEMYDAKAAIFEDDYQPPEEDVNNARP